MDPCCQCGGKKAGPPDPHLGYDECRHCAGGKGSCDCPEEPPRRGRPKKAKTLGRTITVRLDEEALANLEVIQAAFGRTSASSAVRKVISVVAASILADAVPRAEVLDRGRRPSR